MENPKEGATIIAYGQTVKIAYVETVNGKTMVYLEHPIVVPTREYTRNYISLEEIQNYV